MRRTRVALFPFAVAALVALTAAAAFAATVVVDDDGHAAPGNCGATTPAPATIQGGVDAANPGDTVQVCPGTYVGAVVVDKALTLNGAKSAVDGRTQSGGGSIVSAPSGPAFTLNADNVTVAGFTIKNSDVGVQTSNQHSGYLIQNNVITNNTIGIYLNSSNSLANEVRQNKISANNRAGSGSGDGIYSDQGLHNATIDRNAFLNQANAGVLFAAGPGTSNVSINDNRFSNMANSAVSFIDNVSQASIDHNNIVNSAINPNGGSAIFIGGSSNNVSVASNTITLANYSGVAIRDTASAITIANNTIKRAGGNGIDVSSSTSGATTTTGNVVKRNHGDGILYAAGTSGNQINHNTTAANAGFNCQDQSTGTGTAGTANTWSANTGGNSSPPGIC
jgi:parallel beta-helix repeat protein